jgi:hypothetical protein
MCRYCIIKASSFHIDCSSWVASAYLNWQEMAAEYRTSFRQNDPNSAHPATEYFSVIFRIVLTYASGQVHDPSAFSPWKRTCSTCWIEDRVIPRADTGRSGKENNAYVSVYQWKRPLEIKRRMVSFVSSSRTSLSLFTSFFFSAPWSPFLLSLVPTLLYHPF